MVDTFQKLARLIEDESGVTSVEYAVIAGVICITLAGAFTALAGDINTFFSGLTL